KCVAAKNRAAAEIKARAAAEAASQAGQSSKGSQIQSAIAGGLGSALLATNLPTCPKKTSSCAKVALGILALAQAANSASASGQNRGVQRELCGLDCDGADLASIKKGSEQNYGLGSGGSAKIKNLIAKAKKVGVHIEDGKLVTPAGTIPLSKAGSLASIGKSFGLSKSRLAGIQKDIDKIKAKVLKRFGGKIIGVGGGGSGSSSRTSKIIYEDEDYADDGDGNGNGNGDKKRYLASVTGLAKKFGDSMIGVKGDDIFKIIKRAYKSKESMLLTE
ncbi:MAG: hypothetical protein HAW60_06085, partial [Bdellovibrionales bacterium]|nr:hypothetical protein [Bdellovibrionales bacterium]